MNSKQWAQIRSIIEDITARPVAERAAALEQACGGDAELRAAAASLLENAEVPHGFLDPVDSALAGAVISEAAGSTELGRRIGPYRLTEVVAAGGMGTVYRAVRDDGQYEKQVAVKVIHSPLHADLARKQFAREQQALAKLEHPNIARLLDGGTTSDAIAYLVMEFVDGRTITRYCSEARLGLGRRLMLFREVCSAVQYAHQHLVVHRDLKPDNILVNREGQPKLVDFGIARILDEGGADATMTQWRMLTPQYSSPEQVRGEKVSTVGEVYSLGVVLYELLSGQHPYTLQGRERGEAERIICEVDPPPPSQVSTDQSTARGLCGDLDNIVLKALHKDPQRRYHSVEQLSDDIDNYLNGYPVIARPDTLSYRSAKFVRRNLAAVAATVLVTLTLVGGIIGTSLGMVRASQASASATRQAQRATSQADKATRIAKFLEGVLASADPLAHGGENVTLRELLDAAAPQIETDYADDPQAQAVLRRIVGTSYKRLGLMAQAEPYLQAAVEHHERSPQSAADERVAAIEALADYLLSSGRHVEAEKYFRQLLEVHAQFAPEWDDYRAHILSQLAAVLSKQKMSAEAERHYREALLIRRQVFGDQHETVAATLDALGQLARRTGDPEAAESWYREALDIRRALHDTDHPAIALSLEKLAMLYAAEGDATRAESYYQQALAIRRQFVGDNPLALVQPLLEYAALLQTAGRNQEAESAFREALQIAGENLPSWHYVRMVAADHYSRFLVRQQRYQEAAPHLKQVYEYLREHVGDGHQATESVKERLIELYHRSGAPEKAEALTPNAQSPR